MGQGTSSDSLQTPDLGRSSWYTTWSCDCSGCVTQQAGENGKRESQETQQRELWNPALKGWKLPCISAGWGLASESSFSERFKFWWTSCWTWASNAPLQQGRPTASWTVLEWVPPADQGYDLFPLLSTGEATSRVIHDTTGMWAYRSKKKVRKVINDLEHVSYLERLRKLR